MTPPRPVPARWLWLLAAGLMLAEFLVFDAMTSRHHASVYPRWNDQIQYLTEAYTAYDRLQADGLGAGLKAALTKSAVQGTLHDTAAVLVFWVAGSASRSAVLSVNMLAFLAWQAALLFTLTRAGGSRILAWMGFGLVLCVASPWSAEAGSAVDFRLDHGAMCLFGVAGCAALLTDGFRSTRWSLAFGAAVGVTLLARFLTGAYFAPIFAVTAAWLLFRPERGLRLGNLVLAGAVAAALAGPVFWLNREGIYQYYWVGHVTGTESLARLRGFDLGQSVLFVVRNLGSLHLGAWFGWTVAALTAALVGFRYAFPRQAAPDRQADWLALALIFLLLPAAILTYHRQKSEIVLGLLAPGVVLVVLWAWHRLLARTEWPAGRRLLPVLPAVAAVAAGLGYFSYREFRPPHSADFLRGADQVNRLADYIYTRSRAAGLTQPNVGIDRIVDFLDGRTLRVICYERHKVWVDFAVHLPDSILEGPDEVVFFKLKYCDFMVLTNRMPDHGYWPYDKQMRRLYPDLKAWCEANLEPIRNFSAFERDMTFYERKNLP